MESSYIRKYWDGSRYRCAIYPETIWQASELWYCKKVWASVQVFKRVPVGWAIIVKLFIGREVIWEAETKTLLLFPLWFFFSPQLIYYRWFSPDLLHSGWGTKSRHNLLASAWWKQNCRMHIFPLLLFLLLPDTSSTKYLVCETKRTEEGFPLLELSSIISRYFPIMLNSKYQTKQ